MKITISNLSNETDFYKKQKRVALRNCGVIDPENIDEYIAYDGYAGSRQGPHRDERRKMLSRCLKIPDFADEAAPASRPA